MISKLRLRLQRNFLNSQGLKTNRKLIIIESDDWGAVRMPDQKVHTHLIQKGIINSQDAFAKFDGLESEQDLDRLYETLHSVKDSQNNPAVLTANVIVGNPDFKKIKDSEFTQYFFEKVETTSNRERGFDIAESWLRGLNSKVFFPQLHGREHVNSNRWLKKLQQNHLGLIEAFHHGTYAVDHSIVAAFDALNEEEELTYPSIIEDAYNMFESIFNFPSKSFIAPNYTWPKSLEAILKSKKIMFLQGSLWQTMPNFKENSKNRKLRFHGKKNEIGQTYFVRNCLFEPSLAPYRDYVDICLRHIDSAFYWNVPAIIASHRLNFVSVGGTQNRDINLKSLQKLLSSIMKKWPDAEFISTAQYCDMLFK